MSNAGIAIDGGIDTPTDKWQKIIDVNLMSQVFAARYAIPHMLEQGSGYLLNVASAAGLLVIFDTVSYTVTKHAAIGFTEWLAATLRRPGHRRQRPVPGGGAHADPRRARTTPRRAGTRSPPTSSPTSSSRGSREERFMISTHPWVLEKFAVKARDYDEYIATMRAGRAAELARAAAV